MAIMKKPLNIGLVGYGFMGRTHSNAFAQGEPLLRSAVPARAQGRLRARRAKVRAPSPKNGATNPSKPTGASWSSAPDIDLIDIASPNDTHAEIAIAAAKAGKMVLCEKPLGCNAAEAERMVRSGREGRRAEHGLVQLPPRARRDAGQAADRRRPPGPHLPLSRQVPAGLDHLSPICRRAARASGGWMSTSPAAASRAICWPIASTPPSGSTAASTRSPP